ncbi:hypothetical protein RGUI_2712 [Rhodovulum sp. P5]|uniref:tetratricopeptide repeat protein n=1 Tax=Rhodovulum sp. P5 TaxID=1564506 RepID=UPI0009C1B7A3|nr:tetratricopeptide repeat protein [Rhodovulum sp. P5]ARE40853.1 hypothetical protein RGUI_2712 [Rhodovulum sp. P5]
MLLRVLVVVVLAAVFFAIGAWSGGRFPPIREAVVTGTVMAGEKADQAWTWLRDGPVGSESTRVWHCVRDGAPQRAPDTPPAGVETVASVATAREAFARGDLKAAIADYKTVLEDQPDNADILGELGNVYFASGRSLEAAEAFHASAIALIAQGSDAKARALLPTIRDLAPSLAADLDAKLAAPSGPARP